MAPSKKQKEETGDDLDSVIERIKSLNKADMSEYHQQLLKWAKNVDKRYAWVVLAALFLMMSAILGPYRIYGLVYAKVTTERIYTREEASWPVSTIFTVENFVGPLVSIVVYHLSFRQSLLIGGVLLTLANILASLSNSLVLDVILIGVVQGIGYAFIFMPFMEIINSYFLRYRNSALGLALCGGTLSIFAWSPLFQWLLDTHPWRMAYLGIGLVSCTNIIVVPFLKPNPKPKSFVSTMGDNKKSEAVGKQQLSHQERFSRFSVRALTYQNSIRRQSTILIERRARNCQILNRPLETSQSVKYPCQPHPRQASIISVNPFASTVGLERRISRAIAGSFRDKSPQLDTTDNKKTIQDKVQQPINTFNATPIGSPQSIKKQSSALSQLSLMSKQQDNMMQAYETISLSEHDIDEQIDENPEVVSQVILGILKTPAFHLIWYNELLYFWIFSVYCLVLVDFGVDRGCSKEESESLLMYQSIGELLGRLVLTALVDLRFLSNKNVVILVLCIMAGLLTLVTQVFGYIWMASMTVSISAISALLYIMLNGLLVDYLGDSQVTLGYGISSCIGSVLMSFRPQAVGFCRDKLESYNPLMLCLAIGCALGAVLWIIEPLLTRLFRRRSNDDQSQQQQVAA